MNIKNLFAVFFVVMGSVNLYSVMPTTLDEAATKKRMMDQDMMVTMEQPETMMDDNMVVTVGQPETMMEAPTAKCSGFRCLTNPPYPVHPLPAGFGAYTDFEGI